MTRPLLIFRLCVNLFLLGMVGHAMAQDSLQQKSKWMPTLVRVGYEIISPIRAASVDNFSGWEVVAETNVYRYYPTFEMGGWSRSWEANGGSTYSNDGRYWRLGADVNFLTKDKNKNVFSLGFRYGRSTFSEDATLVIAADPWGNFITTRNNNNVSAGWAELTSGLRVKVFEYVWLGYTARFKFSNSIKQNRDLLTTDIPGYGSTAKETTWGFSYYVLVNVPFRK